MLEVLGFFPIASFTSVGKFLESARKDEGRMPNVAVLTGSSSGRTHDFVRGIHDFAESASDWVLHPFDAAEPLVTHELLSWGAHAVIVQVDGVPLAVQRSLTTLSIPLVSFQCSPLACPSLHFPCSVAVAADSISRLIAQHLQSFPSERVGFVSQQTNSHLVRSMSATFGERFQHFEMPMTGGMLRSLAPTMVPELQRWLAISGHAVLVAESDLLAAYLRRLANSVKLRVPQDVSLISLVDSLLCNLPVYSLTAVMLPDREMGYQAARIVSRTLAGIPAPSETTWVDALHLNCRASSVESGQDLAIDRAKKFIEENAVRGITVADVMTFQQTSRVTFERQFQAAVGCTPGDYIRQIKVNKAKALLTETSQSIDSIGKTCGYQSPAKFSSFFKRAVGVSPATFRHQNRPAAPGS